MISTHLGFSLKNLDNNQEFDIDKTTFTVGRDTHCDIVLSEGYPSRVHAQIILKDDTILVDDLHSTNGTYVNNQRVHQATVVYPGDIIKFSTNEFTLFCNQPGDTTVIAKPASKTRLAPSFIAESSDDGDPDDTLLLHTYQLPAGWPVDTTMPDHDRGAVQSTKELSDIDALIAKTFIGHDELYIGALVFKSEKFDPLVYGISIEQGMRIWTIGRSPDCDFSINSPGISELHAELIFSKNTWLLRDKKSTNGLRINGQLRTQTSLVHGSSVVLGDVEMVFRNDSLGI